MNEQEKETVEKMIRLYCRKKHHSANSLCDECAELNNYAHQRLSRCKFGNDKPTCEKCPIHCYKPLMKARVQEVMRYAGPRMLFYHPMTAIKHLIRNIKKNP